MNELFLEVLSEIFDDQPKLFGYDVAGAERFDGQIQRVPIVSDEVQSPGLLR
jgi:hypothetical protein